MRQVIEDTNYLYDNRSDPAVLVNARIINRRPGQAPSWNGVAELAESGPTDRYQLSPTMKTPEELHRLGNIRRCKPADVEVWAAHCPQPVDWIP